MFNASICNLNIQTKLSHRKIQLSFDKNVEVKSVAELARDIRVAHTTLGH